MQCRVWSECLARTAQVCARVKMAEHVTMLTDLVPVLRDTPGQGIFFSLFENERK